MRREVALQHIAKLKDELCLEDETPYFWSLFDDENLDLIKELVGQEPGLLDTYAPEGLTLKVFFDWYPNNPPFKKWLLQQIELRGETGDE